MKITRVSVGSFGVWSGLELPDLSPGLNVVYGANEAGKTTLMQFVRSIFWGFGAERRARYLPPVDGNSAGGSLVAAEGARRFTISRYAQHDHDEGTLSIVDEHNGPHDAGVLGSMLGDVDEPTFNHVFALGLHEIQELATLNDTEAGHLLYDMSLGLDRVSLLDVLRGLEASRSRLLAADDRPSTIGQLLGQQERLQAEVAELADLTPRYLETLSRRGDLGRRSTALDARRGELDRELRIFETIRALSEKWNERQAVTGQLNTLGVLEPMPADGLERLETLVGRAAALRAAGKRLATAGRQAQREAAAIDVNERLCRLAPRLEALNEQQPWIAALGAQVRKLNDEIAALELEREKEGGPKVDVAALPRAPLSPNALAKLRSRAKALAAASRELKSLREQSREKQSALQATDDKLRAALGKTDSGTLVERVEAAGDLVSRLRHRIQLDARLDKLARRQADLEEQRESSLDQQLLPTWILACLGCVFVLGFALILSGFILPTSVVGTLGWPLAILGAVGAGAAAVAKVWIERARAQRLDSCQSEAERLTGSIQDTRQERDLLDQSLPRGGGSWVSRLQAAEAELASLEALLPLESQRKAVNDERSAQRAVRLEAKSRLQDARQRWQRALEQFGLPQGIRPKHLREFQGRLEAIGSVDRRIADLRSELAQRQQELDLVSHRITQVAAEAGRPPAAGAAVAVLPLLLADLAEHREREKRRDAQRQRSRKLRKRWKRCIRAQQSLRARKRRLFREAQARDEADFRSRLLACAEAEQLQRRQQELTEQVALAIHGICSQQQLDEYLGDPALLERRERATLDDRDKVLAELKRSYEENGEINEQLKALANDDRLPRKRLELSVVEERLRAALDRWRVLAVCQTLLDEVRRLYEAERQPEALRDASKYLRRLTAGRYGRVWTTLDEPSLKVEDSQGNSLPVEILSRGTREQVFLSLRLALVGSYARRGIRLPLVLDDVLVNFDLGRATAAAAVLADFARSGCQVFVFTCHDHIAQLFEAHEADVRRLPERCERGVTLLPSVRTAKSDVERRVLQPVAEHPAATALPAGQAESPEVAEAPRDAAPAAQPKQLPPPRPAGSRRARPQSAARAERARWSAEEFEGELADRVRQPDGDGSQRGDGSDAEASSHATEAA